MLILSYRMRKVSFGVLLWIAGLFLLAKGCGSTNGSGGSSVGSSDGDGAIRLLIDDPDPVSAAQSKSMGKAGDFLVSKALTRVNPTSCTLTVSGDDMETVSQSFTYATTVDVTLTIPPGDNRTFAIDCVDASGTTNDITVGFEGSATASLTGGSVNVAITPKFRNLASDDADGIQFLRVNQENSTQSRLTFGFGSALTEAQKLAARCVAEFDTSGTRTSTGVLDASSGTGLTSQAKSGPYILLTGGTTAPECFLYSAGDVKQMRGTGTWVTNDNGNTEARCTFGIIQTKDKLDSNQAGQFAGECSLNGTAPYDLIPNSGYAKYDLSPNANASEVGALLADGVSCSSTRAGETCDSGWCVNSGVCSSLQPVEPDPIPASVGGTGTAGSTNGNDTIARFNNPNHIAVSPDGEAIYVSDRSNHVIRKIDLTVSGASGSYVSTLAGSAGTTGTANGDCTATARFNNPRGIVVSPDSNTVYVSMGASPAGGSSAVRQITLSPCTVGTLAGTGSAGSADGTGTSASFNIPQGMALTGDGKTLFVADSSNSTIRKIVVGSGVVTTFAGTAGSTGTTDGTGTAARFFGPDGLAIDSTDTYLWVVDARNSKIRRITLTTAAVTTFSTSSAFTTLLGGIALDPTKTYLYVTHQRPAEDQVMKVTIADGTVAEVTDTGNGTLNAPIGIAFHPGGTIYYSDTSNHRIRSL